MAKHCTPQAISQISLLRHFIHRLPILPTSICFLTVINQYTRAGTLIDK